MAFSEAKRIRRITSKSKTAVRKLCKICKVGRTASTFCFVANECRVSMKEHEIFLKELLMPIVPLPLFG